MVPAVVFCGLLPVLGADFVMAGGLPDELAEQEQELEEDPWARITTEDWQPGRVGESTTSVPMKDLECEGPQTKMQGDPDVSWALVKDRLHGHLTEPMGDPWLLQVTMNIQRDEPDTCVLGVTSTSAYLLPVTMPKFRNMARTLNFDCNFLLLNVTFYDTLRSGFPIFGIIDGLATPEYRAWFETDEGHYYYPPRKASAACAGPAAVALQEALEQGRRGGRPALAEGLGLVAGGEVSDAAEKDGGCPPALAAAYISYALERAEGADKFRSSEGRDAALRDVIELVSRAEEILRRYTWDEGVAFGELVATPWHLWWLLHRLQLAIPSLLAPWPAWKRPDEVQDFQQEL